MDEDVKRGILTEEKATEILSTYGIVTADVAETGSKKSLAKATKELIASRINLTKADVGMLARVAALVFTIYKCNKAVEEAREKAQELGSSFKDASSEIEDYKSKIEDLQNTIHDSNSSIEDVTEARKSLMSIQDELIDKYGTEQSVIDNVTKSINGQTEALDNLTQSKWQETKNEFNDGGFWNDAANFFQGQDNIERMLNEYGEKTIAIKWADFADINKLTDEMIAKLENIGINIKVNTDNLQGVRDFDSLTESISDTTGASLSITGNAEEIYNQLLSLQELIGNDDSLDKLYDKVENTATSYKDLTDSYKDFYNQYVLMQKILTDDSNYADTFKNITDAYEKYQDAFTSGDESKIKEASDEYAEIVATAMDNAIANGDSDVATYFENMYPTLQSVVDGWKFNLAFDTDTDGLQDKVQSVLDKCKDENGRNLIAEEILGLGEANQQYQDLVSIANSYNMSIEEMIELLKERNLVSAMDYQGLVGLFGQENVNKLSPEDLEIAYHIKNVGNMTFDELQAEIQRLKEASNDTTPLSITETVDQLNTRLKPAFDSLKSAYQDIFTDDGQLDLNSIDILSTCDAIKSKLDELNKIEGITVDYSAFEDFVRVLRNTESTESDVEDAFDSLATSITNAGLSGTEDFETMKAALEDLGVANETIVAFQALAESTEALKESGLDLEDATYAQLDAFAREKLGAEDAAQGVAILVYQQMLIAENPLDTMASIQALANLGGKAAETAGILAELAQIMAQIGNLQTWMSNNPDADVGLIEATLGGLQKRAESLKSQVLAGVDFENVGGGASKAGSAGSKAGDAYVDAFEKELEELETLHDQGKITEKEYLDWLRVDIYALFRSNAECKK